MSRGATYRKVQRPECGANLSTSFGFVAKIESCNTPTPIGHCMYHRFNIQQFYVLSTQCIYVFCVDLRTNSDYFPIHHLLTGFYNRDGVCLLCGTDWTFKSYK